MYPCGVSQASFDRAMDELGPSPEEMEAEEERSMNKADFTYEATANGYMLFYKSKPIGGAGVLLPRARPLRGNQARDNVRDNAASAKREIKSLLAGIGQARFLKVIAEIENQAEEIPNEK